MSQDIKICHLDTETTGLDPERNGVIQIAGFIEINGVEKHGFNMNVCTFPADVIEQAALNVNGRTVEQIQSYKPPQVVHKALTDLFDKFVNKFDKTDKMYLCGYNVGFDDNFMRAWFRKCGHEYYNSYFHGYKIDVLAIAMFLRSIGRLSTENLKLATVAKHYNIPIEAHTALGDVKASRELHRLFKSMIKE